MAEYKLKQALETGILPTRYWHKLEDGRVMCDLCPRACKLHEGQRGLCFVRENRNAEIVLNTYGRSSGYCVDPILPELGYQQVQGDRHPVRFRGPGHHCQGCPGSRLPQCRLYL
jgi:hypothetical protein